MDGKTIAATVEGVTAKWAKQRKAEERHARAHLRRLDALDASDSRRITTKEAAWRVIPDAYREASSDGALPAKARQIMYRARGEIQELTDKALDDQYFTQTLLPDFLRDNAELTANWDVVFDARGHLVEPHTRVSVPLGTLEVRKYLRAAVEPTWPDPEVVLPGICTHGPSHRYSAILFIEKEGFMPLFERVKLAERYDVAIMSTKGVSVTASRRLVDDLCYRYSLPFLFSMTSTSPASRSSARCGVTPGAMHSQTGSRWSTSGCDWPMSKSTAWKRNAFSIGKANGACARTYARTAQRRKRSSFFFSGVSNSTHSPLAISSSGSLRNSKHTAFARWSPTRSRF